MFYLAHDDRPDVPTQRCVTCGFSGSPRSAKVCHRCSAPLSTRRFLVSTRWRRDGFEAFESFAAKASALAHPGLALPVDVVRKDRELLSVVLYRNEGLLLDEAAPLSAQRILHIGQRMAGVFAHLVRLGVQIRPLSAANLLLGSGGSVQLFDPDVVSVGDEPISPAAYADVLAGLGELLLQLCHPRATALVDFLKMVAAGDYPTPRDFGRAVETRFDAYAALSPLPAAAALSDVGLTRQLNEDYWGWTPLGPTSGLYVVADGMGGHDGGEVASRLAVDTICRVALERIAGTGDRLDAIEAALDVAFQSANNLVKAESERKGNDMGTTLVALLVHGDRQAFVANVGDSRAYLFRHGRLHQISVDHSLVQRMVERGRISAEEARTHPHSNILLKTVGTERDVEIDLFRVELERGDRVLLCSDGLWGDVEDSRICAILNEHGDARVAARELVRAAHQGGGKDNVTVLIYTAR